MTKGDLAVSSPALEALDPRRWVAEHQPQARRQCVLPNGLEIACQSRTEVDHIYEDIFEHRVYLSNGVCLWDGACVFDVGGNIGLFTVFVHHGFSDLRTFTFEPVPALFDLLCLNVARHGGPDSRVFRAGVADRTDTAKLTFYPYSSGMSSFHAQLDEEKDVLRTILQNQERRGDDQLEAVMADTEELLDARFTSELLEAPLITLSDVIDRYDVQTIDLLKVDVQKSELNVLRGLRDEHWPRVRQVVLEVHDLEGELRQATDLLHGHGLRTHVEQDPLYAGSVIYNVYAFSRALGGGATDGSRQGRGRGAHQRRALAASRRRLALRSTGKRSQR